MKKTIRDWLKGYFGDSGERVGDDRELMLVETFRPRLTIGASGILQTVCGGLAVMGFQPSNGCRREILLVVDDAKGIKWDMSESPRRSPRPHTELVLKQTA